MRDAERVELVDLAQLAGQLRRRDAIADAHAGRVHRLAEREHHERLLSQLRLHQNRSVRAPVVRDVLVHLVGHDIDVVPADDFRKRVEILSTRRRAGRIVRAVEKNRGVYER